VRIFAAAEAEAGQEFTSRSHSHSEAPVLRALGGVWGESLRGIICPFHAHTIHNSLGYSLC
jgi:hypothetical protein